MSDIYKVDLKRSYGLVYGDPNVRFIQDGNAYGHDGSLFTKSGEESTVISQGQGTVPPAEITETIQAAEDLGIDEALEKQRNKQRSDAMRRIWAARKERLDKESGQ